MNPTEWHQVARITMQERLGQACVRRRRDARRAVLRPTLSVPVGMGLTVVYAVWGSTYLAIRVAIETIPPLLLISVRFLVAGMLLYGWIREVLDVMR